MPSTTNFGWTTPADTDYVKDGASAIRTLAGGIDTSMAQLKGGTTGQILSKTSGTDMAFTWINNDQGDITGVTAGTGLSGGGTSGAVTLSIDTATTVDKTTAQTLTNKTISATSNTLTGVINNTLTTTTGDLIYASSANTPARLAIGSTNQVLTVSGGVPTWAAASSGAMTLISATSLSASSVGVNNVFSSTYQNYHIVINITNASSGCNVRIRLNNGSGDSSTNYVVQKFQMYGTTSSVGKAGTDMWQPTNADPSQSLIIFDIARPYDADKTWAWGMGISSDPSTNALTEMSGWFKNDSTSYTGFTIYSHNGATLTGTARVYGVSN